MTMLKDQGQGSPQRGLPVEERNGSNTVTTISDETVQFYFSDSGARTADAGEAAGTAVEGCLVQNRILNEQGKLSATSIDTSLSFTSTALTDEVPINLTLMEAADAADWADRLAIMTSDLANGEYRVDYVKGIVYGKKASTQTELASTTYIVASAPSAGTVNISGTVDVDVQNAELDVNVTNAELDVNVTNTTAATAAPTSTLLAPVVDSYSCIPINLAAGNNQQLVAAPGANKQIWVYGIVGVLTAAGSFTLQDEDDTAETGVMVFDGNKGVACGPTSNFAMPIMKVATNKALEADVVTSDFDGWLTYAIIDVS